MVICVWTVSDKKHVLHLTIIHWRWGPVEAFRYKQCMSGKAAALKRSSASIVFVVLVFTSCDWAFHLHCRFRVVRCVCCSRSYCRQARKQQDKNASFSSCLLSSTELKWFFVAWQLFQRRRWSQWVLQPTNIVTMFWGPSFRPGLLMCSCGICSCSLVRVRLGGGYAVLCLITSAIGQQFGTDFGTIEILIKSGLWCTSASERSGWLSSQCVARRTRHHAVFVWWNMQLRNQFV